jgi:hypothetical protein
MPNMLYNDDQSEKHCFLKLLDTGQVQLEQRNESAAEE